MKKFKGKIILCITVLSLLLISYFWGGNIPNEKDMPKTKVSNVFDKKEEIVIEKEEPQKGNDELHKEKVKQDEQKEEEKKTNEEQTFPQNSEKDNEEQTHICKLYVMCNTILDNMDLLNQNKAELIPKDGVIYKNENVLFYEGESVFNVLQREMRANKIHLEFVKTPVYNSVYIEGINNIYEFDCGELSGWVYKVNKNTPNYGCSLYKLKDNDIIEWLYTCDLGKDIGGYNNLKKE